MLKAPGYQMVEENSKYDASYFYQINHAIRKSVHYLMEGDTPYLRNAEVGLPGNRSKQSGLSSNYPSIAAGTTHGDELLYLFNAPIPIALCPLDVFFG